MTVIPEGSGDKWVPPPWHAPAHHTSPAAQAPRPGKANVPDVRRRPGVGTTDTARQVVLSLAFAPGATGVLAMAMAFLGLMSGAGAVPIGLLLIIALQVVGYIVVRRTDAATLARSWLISFVSAGGLLPTLSILVSLFHEPYVSIGWNSATPAIVATVVVILFMVILAVWCGTASWSIPEAAAITFLPAALLVPAVLGIQSTATHRTALESLAVASLFAAGAIVLAWSLPRGARLLVPPIAFGGEALMLWIAGREPSIPESNGGIVIALYAVAMIVTGALVVALPFFAAWLKYAIEYAEETERPRRHSTDEGISAS